MILVPYESSFGKEYNKLNANSQFLFFFFYNSKYVFLTNHSVDVFGSNIYEI